MKWGDMPEHMKRSWAKEEADRMGFQPAWMAKFAMGASTHAVPVQTHRTCPKCDGSGEVPMGTPLLDLLGFVIIERPKYVISDIGV